MKKIILFAALALAPGAFAQTNRYSATTDDVVLSAAATTLTLQKAATSPKPATMESATVYCSVPCSVNQAYNGTAATTTAVSAVPIPPNTQVAASATPYKASNVGGGTNVFGIIHVPAGGTITIYYPGVQPNGAPGNYSITVAAITGTANITIIWSEPQ